MKFNKNKYEGFCFVPRKNKAKQAHASPASNSTEAWWWICDLQAVPGKIFLGDIKLHTNQYWKMVWKKVIYSSYSNRNMIYQTKEACCHYSPWWSDHASIILTSSVAHLNVDNLARSWGQQWRWWRRLWITPQGEGGKKLDRSSWRREMDRLHAGDLQICERLEEKADLLWMTDSLWGGIRLLGSQRPFFMPEPLNMGKTSEWLNPFSFQTFTGKRNKNLKKPCFIGIFWRSITKRIDWC